MMDRYTSRFLGTNRFSQHNFMNPQIRNYFDESFNAHGHKMLFAKADEKMVITIYGDINWYQSLQEFDSQVNETQFDKMELRINSYGGDVWPGLAIYNRLKNLKKPVDVYIDGMAASAASIIAMGGDTIYIPETGMIMIHNPYTLAMGDARHFRDIAEKLEAMQNQMVALYQRRTGIEDASTIAKMMDVETELYGADAVEKGFADILLEDAGSEEAKVQTSLQGNETGTIKAETKIEAKVETKTEEGPEPDAIREVLEFVQNRKPVEMDVQKTD